MDNPGRRVRAAPELNDPRAPRRVSVSKTRNRIAEAVRSLLIEDGFAALTIGQIAERAGVARSTVYYEFDSKPKLLRVVLDEAADRSGVSWLASALRPADPIESLQRTLTLACRFWFSEYPLFQRVLALSAADPEIAEVIANWDEDRHRAMLQLTEKLHTSRKLRPEVSKREALSVLSLSTSFETFKQLLAINIAVPDRIAATLFSMCSCVLKPS